MLLKLRSLKQLEQTLKKHACPQKAKQLARFFKTGPGEYAQGERFYGINVPTLRIIAHQFQALSQPNLTQLLQSPMHEERFIALLIFINQYQSASSPQAKSDHYQFYCAHMKYINNWDLVDLSAPKITGDYLLAKDRRDLHKWIKDPNMWIRRIAIVATLTFIRNGDLEFTLLLGKQLLSDKQDLIHKALGWMLREVGKKDIHRLQQFLMQYYHQLPRTTLRYAIERFPPEQRQVFLLGTFNVENF